MKKKKRIKVNKNLPEYLDKELTKIEKKDCIKAISKKILSGEISDITISLDD